MQCTETVASFSTAYGTSLRIGAYEAESFAPAMLQGERRSDPDSPSAAIPETKADNVDPSPLTRAVGYILL